MDSMHKKTARNMLMISLMLLITPMVGAVSANTSYLGSIEDYCDMELVDSNSVAVPESDIVDQGIISPYGNDVGHSTVVIVTPEVYNLNLDCSNTLQSGTMEMEMVGHIDQDGIASYDPSDYVTISTHSYNPSFAMSLPIDATGATAPVMIVHWTLDATDTQGLDVEHHGRLVVFPIADTSNDTTPRISLWYGKVNQHNENGVWMTDPDGVSGGGSHAQWGNEGYGDRKLEYCQKFWPSTVSIQLRPLREMITFYTRSNAQGYETIKDVYECVMDNNTVSDNGTGEDNNTVGNNNTCIANIELTRSDPGDDGSYPRTWEIYGFTGDGLLTNSDFDAGVFVKSVSYNGEQIFTVDVTSFVETLIASGDQYVGFTFRQYINLGPNTDVEFGGSVLELSGGSNPGVVISSDVHGFARNGGGLNANKFQVFDTLDRGVVEYNILSLAQTDCGVDNSTGDNNTVDNGTDDNNTVDNGTDDNSTVDNGSDDNNTGNNDTQIVAGNGTLSIVEFELIIEPSQYHIVRIRSSGLDYLSSYSVDWVVKNESSQVVVDSGTDSWTATSAIHNTYKTLSTLENGTYCLYVNLSVSNSLLDSKSSCITIGDVNNTDENTSMVSSKTIVYDEVSPSKHQPHRVASDNLRPDLLHGHHLLERLQPLPDDAHHLRQ